MKAEIDDSGRLVVIAESNIESYALDAWMEKNLNGCDYNFKVESPYRVFGIYTAIPKITLFHRIWFKIQLFFYR
jgi:hypothetical protein